MLILPGDALYRMDYRKMIEQHRESGAQITVAVNTVEQSQAHHFGLLAIDEKGKITKFAEKPKTREEQQGFEAPANLLDGNQKEDMYLASMGAYLFNREVLNEFLTKSDDIDFGKQIIPKSISLYDVQAHIFPGYWEDIGTIGAFYKTHMDFLSPPSPIQALPGPGSCPLPALMVPASTAVLLLMDVPLGRQSFASPSLGCVS